MGYTLNLTNTTQTNLNQVIVNTVPIANPEDLIWTPGGTGTTTVGNPGTIFANLGADQVNPPYWYHGGNPPIDTSLIELAGCDIIQATYTTRDVISDFKQKGIHERRLDNPVTITNATAASPIVITAAGHGYTTGDNVFISGVFGVNAANGLFTITVLSLNTFELNGTTGVGSYFGGGIVQRIEYFWDEIYTTPLGLYQSIDQLLFPNPNFFEFNALSNNSNELKVYIDDPNIVPKVGDSMTIQRFFDSVYSFTNDSTTDGQNNVKIFPEAELYVFKITAVSSVVNPLLLSTPYIEYTLTLDKSFKPNTNVSTKYFLTLLNRIGTGLNKELFTDTWQLHEVQRQQLLGDPYNFIGVTQPKGRKNYLYYKGSEFLGMRMLLNGVLDNNKKTPFIVFDFDDDIRDRIAFDFPGEVEVHLPTIMIQSESSPVILINNNAANLPDNGVINDVTGTGHYSPLYLQTANSPRTRYGWVFHDLRIVVIDHPELTTALSYNANRNYTLPDPVLPQAGNSVQNATPSNPLIVTNATNTNPIQITTSLPHNFSNANQVIISDVQGNSGANTPANTVFYVNVISNTVFEIYQDVLLTIGVDGTTSNPYVSGTGTAVGTKLPYEYFVTYRINGIHYDTLPYAEVIPFNFQTNGKVNNSSGDIQIDFTALSHLVDNNVLTGFEADTYEIIIGRYVASVANIYEVASITDTVIATTTTLKTAGVQDVLHTQLIPYITYTGQIGLSDYDILNNQPIYTNTTPLPDTLVTAEGDWLVGFIKHKEHIRQYRMTFTFTAPADKWNGTTNPSFEPGNVLQPNKIITEIAFLVDDLSMPNGVDEKPYIYGKVSPAIKKDNVTDLTFQISLDF